MVVQHYGAHSLADVLGHSARPQSMSRTMMYAIGGAVLLHAIAGYYVYKQRFEVMQTQQDDGGIIVTTVAWKDRVPPKTKTDTPPQKSPPQNTIRQAKIVADAPAPKEIIQTTIDPTPTLDSQAKIPFAEPYPPREPAAPEPQT